MVCLRLVKSHKTERNKRVWVVSRNGRQDLEWEEERKMAARDRCRLAVELRGVENSSEDLND